LSSWALVAVRAIKAMVAYRARRVHIIGWVGSKEEASRRLLRGRQPTIRRHVSVLMLCYYPHPKRKRKCSLFSAKEGE